MILNDAKNELKNKILQHVLLLNKLGTSDKLSDIERVTEINKKMRALVLIYNSYDFLINIDENLIYEDIDVLNKKYNIEELADNYIKENLNE